jgi:tetratricopeptide (TPR) repeat protein
MEALLSGDGLPTTELIELGPLSEGAVAELVARLSGRAAVLFPRRLHAATGGNAFFVLETLRGLFEAGELHSEDAGGWSTRYDDVTENYLELPLPPSVRQAVLARASRLGAAVRRLLEVGSLAGEPFALETLTQASALAEWEALEGLEAATAAQLLRADEDGYRFAHELARRALAQAQSPERRRLIHRRLARQLELSAGPSAVIAGHLEQAARPAEAAAAWVRAAQEAQVVYANAQALSHLDQALSALPDGAPERFEVQARREVLARELGERGVQEQALSAMEELAAGTAQQLSALLRRSNFLSIMGRPHEALSAAERAEALARAQGRSAEQAEAHIRLASALYYVEDFERALTQATVATALPDLTPAQQVQALNLSGMIHAVLRDPEAALADYAAALLVLGAAPDALLSARIHNNRATTLCLYGAYGLALDDTSASLALIAQHGFRQLEGFVLDTRARALRGLGRFPEAQQALEAATSLAKATGNQRLVSHCLHHRIQLLGDQGQFAAALNASDEALALASATASVSNRLLTLAARAWAYLALGHPQRALADARQAALPGVDALREALPESLQLMLAQALEACAQPDEAQAILVTARASMRARLAHLHQPALRQAFTALPLWRALFGADQT